jgi:hypothetical protein
MPDISAIFGQPFAQQLAAWRLRLGELRGTTSWTDVEPQFHDRGFMVAGAMTADLLADLAAAVDKAISQGTSLEEFRRDFREIVARQGWHGWTGEGSKRGEAWRTRTIYRTNMATTYAAGRRAQLVDGGFAWWVYRHGGSREPRILHLGWNGIALPPDHPFWQTHSPPNGWGCSCYVVGARTRAGIRRAGGDPDKPLPDNWQGLDPRTGAPRGIDKGWAYAPGARVDHLVAEMAAKAVNWDYSLATAYMRGLPVDVVDRFSRGYRSLPGLADDLRRWSSKVIEAQPAAPQRSLGLVTAEQRTTFERLTGADLSGGLYDFAVASDAVRHIQGRHGDERIELTRGQRAVAAADFGRLGALINSPDQVQAGDVLPGRPAVIRFEKSFDEERLVALFEIRTGRRRLNLVTMWVEWVAGASPTMTP